MNIFKNKKSKQHERIKEVDDGLEQDQFNSDESCSSESLSNDSIKEAMEN